MKVSFNNIELHSLYNKRKLKEYILVNVLAKLLLYNLPLALVVAIFDPIGWKIVIAIGILFGFYSLLYLLANFIDIQI
jgi:hypothetical protein